VTRARTVATLAVAGAGLASTLPYWLPRRVVALRGAIFTLVNGADGMPVLARPDGMADFTRIYADPAANGRSHGAGLSDLFWYWLAPGPQVHQEHLEPGPRYDQAARVTRIILASRTKAQWAELVTRCTARVLDQVAGAAGGAASRPVRLRDLMMPVWAEAYYELVFGEPCPPAVRDLIVGNADDVVSALKCTRLRHMRRRDRLTRYLRRRIDAGEVPFGLPDFMTAAEQAYYLQGTFFNTAVVQMSEAMAHLLLAIAQHPKVQARLRDRPSDEEYLADVINEAMRVWPLFGIAHRITTADIDVTPPITAGSVLLFDYLGFHHGGGAGAEFDPARWERESARMMNFIPFGVSANRPCPARGVAPVGMHAAVREVLRRCTLSSSVSHTRSLANRAPAFLTMAGTLPPSRSRLALMRLRDRWEDVWRSVVQLVLGTLMVADARRLGLCRNYFAGHPEHLPVLSSRDRQDGPCPVTSHH
jgi:cytochrome P450